MAAYTFMFCTVIGFAVSGLVASLFQWISAERADFLVDRTTVAGNLVAVVLSMTGGPYILTRNAVAGAWERRIPFPLAVALLAVAMFWSLCAGIVYFSLLFSS